MTLVPVELAVPEQLRRRWAAYSAVMAAIGFADASWATGNLWHYDDGGGNWCELVVAGSGRALLFGQDHEYSETAWAEEPVDLFAGAPSWWAEQLKPVLDGRQIGFVYGYEDAWQRAGYGLSDGFAELSPPAESAESLVEAIADFVAQYADDHGAEHVPSRDAVLGLDGPELTESQMSAVLGPAPADLAAGVTAARAFG